MAGPVVIAMPDDRQWAESITDELIEDNLSPKLEIVSDVQDNLDLSKTQVVVLVISSAVAERTPLSESYLVLAREACASGKAIAVWIDDVPDIELNCTRYNLKHRERPKGFFKPFMLQTLALKDITAGARYKASGRDPPPPSAPRRLAIRYVATLSSTIILPIVAVLSFTDVLIGLTGALGLDERASSEAKAAYSKIPIGSCQALRDFVNDFDPSKLTNQAVARLELREEREEIVKQNDRVFLPILILPDSNEAYSTQPKAAAVAEGRAKKEATKQCGLIAEAGDAVAKGFILSEVQSTCDRFAAGYACRTRAIASCELEQERTKSIEWCP